MSNIYVPGAFHKKIENITSEPQPQLDLQPVPKPQRSARQPVELLVNIPKPVEVKNTEWVGKKSYIDLFKSVDNDNNNNQNKVVESSTKNVNIKIKQEIRDEVLHEFMNKYDDKLKKLYKYAVYYDQNFLDKLRIDEEHGYKLFCKFMYEVI